MRSGYHALGMDGGKGVWIEGFALVPASVVTTTDRIRLCRSICGVLSWSIDLHGRSGSLPLLTDEEALALWLVVGFFLLLL